MRTTHSAASFGDASLWLVLVMADHSHPLWLHYTIVDASVVKDLQQLASHRFGPRSGMTSTQKSAYTNTFYAIDFIHDVMYLYRVEQVAVQC